MARHKRPQAAAGGQPAPAPAPAAWFTPPLTLVGHPFAVIGMGEQMRQHLRALRSIGLQPLVHDLFRHAARTETTISC